MRGTPRTPARDAATLLRDLARRLLEAKSDRDVASALLQTACALIPQGAAVYVAQGDRLRREAASGSGLAYPSDGPGFEAAGYRAHRFGRCVLVHEPLPDRDAEGLLADAASLAGAALGEVGRKTALRRELAAAYRLARSVRSAEDPRGMLQEIVDSVRDALGCRSVQVLLCDEPSGDLIPVALSGTRLGVPRVPKGRGITGWVAQHGEAVLAPNVADDPRYFRYDELSRSELCVPLLLNGQVIGVLNAEADAVDHFAGEDLTLMAQIQQQVAAAAALARTGAPT